jgi:hypothetical protein
MFELTAIFVLLLGISTESIDDKPELIAGRGSAQRLLYRKYCYTLRKATASKKFWECLVRSCRAHITTSTDGLAVLRYLEHNHPADTCQYEARKCRARLIESIKSNPNQATTKLCRSELVKMDPDLSGALPSQHALARNLRYYRAQKRPALPKCVAELRIPNCLTITKSGNRFILFQELDSDSPMLVYASDFSLINLCVANVVTCNGTFDCVPTIFQQLFTLNYFYNFGSTNCDAACSAAHGACTRRW